MVEPRRSSRARRPAESVYEDAKQQLEEKLASTPSRKKRKRVEEDPENSDEEAEVGSDEDEQESKDDDEKEEEVRDDEDGDGEKSDEMELDDNESDDGDDGEDYDPKPKKKPATPKSAMKKSPKSNQPKTPKSKKKVKIQLTHTRTPRRGGTRRVTRGGRSKNNFTALKNLAKKVLEDDETPETSLLAALFLSHTAKPEDDDKSLSFSRREATPYTYGLERAAKRVCELSQEDANKAAVELLNLLFRCVGGGSSVLLDPDEIVCDELDSDQWGDIVTDLVDDMRYAEPHAVLICADPLGWAHTQAVEKIPEGSDVKLTPAMSVAAEFRVVFEEFWFVLGRVALGGGTNQTTQFQTMMINDMMVRINGLVSAGQPDVRAAATIASMQLGIAMVHRSKEIDTKVDTATRQLHASKASKSKVESLKHLVSSLGRSLQDIEETVEGLTIKAVFVSRYRDTNPHIRAFSLKSLSKMSMLRPDTFLTDKYLKYFGWMISDKQAVVRRAALLGLLAPFDAIQKDPDNESEIDIGVMQKVITKFLRRIADRALDVSTSVQEVALRLIVRLAAESFMDDEDDDAVWDQINACAIDPDTTPEVRKLALYFIIDQLESFDDEDAMEEEVASRFKKKKGANLTSSQLKMDTKKWNDLGGWVANMLSPGEDGEQEIQVQLADQVIHSLRAMPEQKDLLANWASLLSAIADESDRSTTTHVAKQRVLAQMLSCAVQAAMGHVDPNDEDGPNGDVDPEVLAMDLVDVITPASKGDGKLSLERLSIVILQALPNLLVRFKTDGAVLSSLAKLPRFLLPSVLSVPQRKKDFSALLKSLVEIFNESTDEDVLSNVVLSLSVLARGDHARAKDTLHQMELIAKALSRRVAELLGPAKKRAPTRKSPRKSARSQSLSGRSPPSTQEEDDALEPNPLRDMETSLALSLMRLKVLIKRTNVSDLLGKQDPTKMEELCGKLFDGLKKRLKDRQVITTQDEDDVRAEVPPIWKEGSQRGTHAIVARTIMSALDVLLSNLAWSRKATLTEDWADDMEEENADEHIVVKQRDQLVDLLTMCFEQNLPSPEWLDEGEAFPDDLEEFAKVVQSHACWVSGDLRSLLRREFEDASTSHLRAFALTQDQALISGSMQYLRSRAQDLQALDRDSENEEEEDGGDNANELATQVFLPFLRNLSANWKACNRREAGQALSHITGSGEAVSGMLAVLARKVKQIDTVRLLESQMACMRILYDDWFDDEPPEPESDRPTEAEMDTYSDLTEKHQARFETMKQKAARLASLLGIAHFKGTRNKIATTLLAFFKEGIRYSFSVDDPNDDEGLLPGARLTFLHLLGKYASWIKKNRQSKAEIFRDLDEREELLKQEADYGEVHEDDLAALREFRETMGEPKKVVTPTTSGDEQSIDGEDLTHVTGGTERTGRTNDSHTGASDSDSNSGGGGDSMTLTPSSSKARASRKSMASSAGSIRSFYSKSSMTQGSLSPLPEGDDEDADSPPAKRIRRSVESPASLSTMNSTVAGASAAGDNERESDEEEGSAMASLSD